MKRLTKNQKIKISKFIKQGKSLNCISKNFGVGKTTIYYYMRKINGKKIKPIIIDKSDEQKIGEFIGLFAGDGSYFFEKYTHIHRIRIHLNKKEVDIIRHYSKVIEKLFGKSPNLVDEKYCVALELRSKEVINFIRTYLEWCDKKTYTVRLVKTYTPSKDFLMGFLRGLIDSDGYVRRTSAEVHFGSTSVNLHKNFIDALTIMKIKSKCNTQITKSNRIFYHSRIAKDDAIRFISLVKPIKASEPTGI